MLGLKTLANRGGLLGPQGVVVFDPVVALPLPVIPAPPGVLLVAPAPPGAADPLPEPDPMPEGVVEVAPVPVAPVPLFGSQPTFITSKPAATASNFRTFI